MHRDGERVTGEVAAMPAPASILSAGDRVVITSGELTIGRAEENGLVVAHERVSRHHARVYAERDRWWVADLGSRHGTLLNGERLREDARPLENGDAIAIADRELRFLS